MVLKRLTQAQKNEILEGYRLGKSTSYLANKFNCSSNTIQRTVKALISQDEYELLKEKRSKNNKANDDLFSCELSNKKDKDLDSSIFDSSRDLFDQKTENDDSDNDKFDDLSSLEQNEGNNLEEIPPLESSYEFDIEKKKSELMLLDNEILPDCVYMLVDKKVELDAQPISSLPEWSFLPEDELNRNAILLFSNQRSAKRNCSKNQRVIKIPNTKVFKITKSFLISKGITRLILEDYLISLSK